MAAAPGNSAPEFLPEEVLDEEGETSWQGNLGIPQAWSGDSSMRSSSHRLLGLFGVMVLGGPSQLGAVLGFLNPPEQH